MKKKLAGLIVGCFMAVFSLFSLASCSLVSVDKAKQNSSVAVVVGDTQLTQSDIISSFYNYYQTNSNYFSYYDEDTIVDSFYTWVAMRQILSDKIKSEVYDAEKNPTGFIFYTAEDEKDVWKSVKDYFYNQVSSYEKGIYSLAGYEENNYPVWLRDSEEETTSGFSAYKSSKPEIKEKTKEDAVAKLSDEEVKKMFKAEGGVYSYIFEYVTGKDENDEDIRESITYDGYIENSRYTAYIRYLEWLVSSAKSNGSATDEKSVVEAEVLRLYNSYYESKISSLFQDYYIKNFLTNVGGNGDGTTFNDKQIVKEYLKQYFSDLQSYKVENAYITALTSTDGASLVLYNYNGKNFFFTVQHILVSMDDYLKNKITKLDSYTSDSSVDYEYYEKFLEDRKALVETYQNVLTKLNEDNLKETSPLSEYLKDVKYYYFDEEKNDDNGAGYIELTCTENEDGSKKFTYTDGEDGEIIVDESDAIRMASADEILKIYKNAYSALTTTFKNYFDGTVEEIPEEFEDFDYIFETLDNIKANIGTGDEAWKLAERKIASFIFVELQFLFSSDSLDNKLSNKIGYVMSNYEDENGSWVAEFAQGARDLVKKLADASSVETGDNKSVNAVEGGIESVISSGDITGLTTTILSQYGYHIIKIEDIYAPDETLVDMTGIDNLSDLDAITPELVKKLKSTYICSASNETVYDYFYDKLYTSLAGDGTSSNAGTYFLKIEYKWLHDYYYDNKIEYIKKLSYDELMNSIK